MIAGEQCFRCKRGYLVPEYSKSEGQDNHYCNHCFKYATEGELGAVRAVRDSCGVPTEWEDLTTDEINDFLDRIFRQFK